MCLCAGQVVDSVTQPVWPLAALTQVSSWLRKLAESHGIKCAYFGVSFVMALNVTTDDIPEEQLSS